MLPHPNLRIRLIRLSVVVLALGIALVSALPAAALERRSGDLVAVQAGQVIDDDLAIAGNTITIAGQVRGDVFAAGNTVTVLPGAHIEGDLFAAGNLITVNGAVDGSVRAAGNVLNLSERVGSNVLAAGNQVTLSPAASVAGNWISSGATTFLGGTIEGNATSASESVVLGGNLKHNVEIWTDRMEVQPTAAIGGNLTYTSWNAQTVPDTVVGGEVRHLLPPEPTPAQRTDFTGFGTVFSLLLLVGTIIAGLLIAWLTPGVYRAALAVLETRGLVAFAVGLAALIVTPVVAVLLLITVIGIPIGLLTFGTYFAIWFIGWIVAATALASLLVGMVRRDGRPIAAGWLVALGLIGLHLLTRIPFLGGLIGFVVVAIGFGIVALLIADRLRPPTPAPPVVVGPVAPEPAD